MKHCRCDIPKPLIVSPSLTTCEKCKGWMSYTIHRFADLEKIREPDAEDASDA